MDWEKLFISKLLVAVPEIAWSDEIIKRALDLGIFNQTQLDDLNYWKSQVDRARSVSSRLSSRTLAQRLMILAPELISTRSVNLLRRLNVVTERDGHILRLLVRSAGAAGILPGALPRDADLAARITALRGVLFSNEVVDLLRAIPVLKISAEEANFLRGALLAADRQAAVRAAIAAGDGLINTILLVGAELLNEEFIRAAVLTGAMDARTARYAMSLLKVGRVAWRTSTKVWNASGFEARALISATGLLSPEMLKFLRDSRIIDARTYRALGPATQIARTLAKTRLDKVTDIRRSYRVLPGESPIATFARTSRTTEAELIRLLNDAAEATRAQIAALADKPGIGAKARRAQERILLDSLYGEMRALWEGVGYLTIFGEGEAARAAVDSMDFLQKNLWRDVGGEADQVRRGLREAGRAGVDSLISREENLKQLSRRVYKNIAFTNQRISRQIQIGLLRGLSAKELAETVADLIRPSVRGGVSYAAQRLARTEINNAFHLTSIRYTREMPWVQGYKWNLSGTHSKRVKGGDVCDDLAGDDRYGLGRGNYPKSEVPSKPHPQCLCFTTIMTMSSSEFQRQYRRGVFNSYLNSRAKAGLYDDTPDRIAEDAMRVSRYGSALAERAGSYGAAALLSAGARIITAGPGSF